MAACAFNIGRAEVEAVLAAAAGLSEALAVSAVLWWHRANSRLKRGPRTTGEPLGRRIIRRTIGTNQVPAFTGYPQIAEWFVDAAAQWDAIEPVVGI